MSVSSIAKESGSTVQQAKMGAVTIVKYAITLIRLPLIYLVPDRDWSNDNV